MKTKTLGVGTISYWEKHAGRTTFGKSSTSWKDTNKQNNLNILRSAYHLIGKYTDFPTMLFKTYDSLLKVEKEYNRKFLICSGICNCRFSKQYFSNEHLNGRPKKWNEGDVVFKEFREHFRCLTVDWLVGWLAGWLAGWLVAGWLMDV